VVLLVCSGNPRFNAHPYLALRKAGAATEFKALYPNQVTGWIERMAKDRGFAIEPKAALMLADYVGTQLQAAESELEKLATFAGAREVLTAEDVVQASGQTREFNVFELQKAIGEMRQNDAIRITERLLQQTSNQRGECTRIITVLTSYYIKLWKLTACRKQRLSEKEMARRIGVSPFYIKEYLECLRRIDGNALNRAFSALLAADYELKGGSSRSEKLVLNLMLRRMMTPVIVPQRLSSKKMGAFA
jgi:DNA polymerase-3 subunit delta